MRIELTKEAGLCLIAETKTESDYLSNLDGDRMWMRKNEDGMMELEILCLVPNDGKWYSWGKDN